MRGAPTSRSLRSAPPERGMTYRTRVPRSQSPHSSQRWGEPATGRRGTGGAAFERERVRDGHLPELSGGRTAGELLDIERVPSSSERGRRKSAGQGNSLAAYSIARTDLWEPWRVIARATRPRRPGFPLRRQGDSQACGGGQVETGVEIQVISSVANYSIGNDLVTRVATSLQRAYNATRGFHVILRRTRFG